MLAIRKFIFFPAKLGRIFNYTKILKSPKHEKENKKENFLNTKLKEIEESINIKGKEVKQSNKIKEEDKDFWHKNFFFSVFKFLIFVPTIF